MLKSKVKLTILVEGDPKAPFSIATTPSCKGGLYSISWIAPFTLDTYLIMLSVKQGDIKYHFFLVFGMHRPGIEPRSPGPLTNALFLRSIVIRIPEINTSWCQNMQISLQLKGSSCRP